MNEIGAEARRHTTATTAGPLFVTSENDEIIRTEPLQFRADEVDSWQLEKNGKVYRPPLTQPVLPWGLAAKQVVDSENRVLHPMKRVDWDPSGKRHPEMRGISAYERITWDEAFDILQGEFERIGSEYGYSAIGMGHSAHPEWGQINYFFSDEMRFMDMLGCTYLEFPPVSWEGWLAGATFVWGNWSGFGLPPAQNTLQDITEHSDCIVVWGVDNHFHNIYNGIDTARAWQYWKELGKDIIVIDPFLNETAAALGAKWIPITPGTDAALGSAIAYVWITEGSFDRGYLDTHAVGFDDEHLPEGVPAGQSFKAYVLGEGPDGVPKTPEWAASHCGVPERTIVELARIWGAKPTSLWAMYSGTCRREYAHEWNRLAAVLQIMQGLGKPGVNIIGGCLSLGGVYDNVKQVGPGGYADGGMNLVLENYYMNRAGSVDTQLYPDIIDKPDSSYFGTGCYNMSASDYFKTRTYPEQGNSEIHMLYYRGSSIVNPPDHKRDLGMFRNPKIETFVVAAPWFDRDCRYADLVLPITTAYERMDITQPGAVGKYSPPAVVNLRSVVLHQECVSPRGESKNDMEIFDELSHRLGFGDAYLEGNTLEDIVRKHYEGTTVPMSYDEFKEKGYYVWPDPTEFGDKRKQFQDFYEDPEGHPLVNPNGQLDTPTGKFEIFSTQLWERYGYDEEIPPVPHYIPEREGAESTELREKYPLQLLTAHPKFRFHGKFNDVEWLRENYKVYVDGYGYEPVWIRPDDAAARGIEDGDIVRCFNDRGEVLAGAKISRRLAPGVAMLTYGSWNDPLGPDPSSLDRGGDANLLTNAGPMSKHHPTAAMNSTLFEIERADLDAIRKAYPDGWDGKFRTWNRRG